VLVFIAITFAMDIVPKLINSYAGEASEAVSDVINSPGQVGSEHEHYGHQHDEGVPHREENEHDTYTDVEQ